MQTVRAVVSTAIADSARVQQVGGMFDLGVPARVETVFSAELPDRDEPWRIGCIVGPSGSGKSAIARQAYGDDLARDYAWPERKAVVDCFGNLPIKRITGMLTAVGFSSPPAWIRPFATLSNGEQFRANLARALLLGGDLICYDEFTSVVDRTVARIGSAAVSKSIRKGTVAGRFVAVTCHYDVLPWLEPDWVLDTSDFTLSRRRLRRPKIRLEICRCLSEAWGLFKRHHYLSDSLSRSGVRCFLGLVDGRPVAFAALLTCPGLAGALRVSRVVVLPDWQGVGLGRAFCDGVGELCRQEAQRLYLRTSHTMMIRCLSNDPLWIVSELLKHGSANPGGAHHFSGGNSPHRVSHRPGVSFRYVGPPAGEISEKRPEYPRHRERPGVGSRTG